MRMNWCNWKRRGGQQTSFGTPPNPGPSWNTRGSGRSRPGAAPASAGRLSSISGTAEWYGKCRLPDMLPAWLCCLTVPCYYEEQALVLRCIPSALLPHLSARTGVCSTAYQLDIPAHSSEFACCCKGQTASAASSRTCFWVNCLFELLPATVAVLLDLVPPRSASEAGVCVVLCWEHCICLYT